MHLNPADWGDPTMYPGVKRARLTVDLPGFLKLSRRNNIVVQDGLGLIQAGIQMDAVEHAKQAISDLKDNHGRIPISFDSNHARRTKGEAKPYVAPVVRPGSNAVFGALALAAKRTRGHARHLGSAVTVNLNYGLKRVGDGLRRAGNPGGNYWIPAGAVLPFLAGCYGRPILFAASIIGANHDELYAINEEIGRNRPFFTRRCLRAAVQDAAIEAVSGLQNTGTALQVDNAHHVVAIYIGNDPGMRANNSGFTTTVFHRIFLTTTHHKNAGAELGAELLSEGVDQSEFLGAVAGICLAGVLRYGKRLDEQADKRRDRFKLALNMVAAAIGGAVMPGAGAIAGVVAGLAEPLANHVFHGAATGYDEDVMRLGGNLEATKRHLPAGIAPGIDAQRFCDTMQETVHRCGFAF